MTSSASILPSDFGVLREMLWRKKVAHKTLSKISNWIEVIGSHSGVSPPQLSTPYATPPSALSTTTILNSLVDLLLGVDDPLRRKLDETVEDVGTMVQHVVEASFNHSSDSGLRGAAIRVFGSAATGLQMESLNSDVDLMIQPLGKQTNSSELSMQQIVQAKINTAESDLQVSSIYADSLSDLASILDKFKTDANATLQSIALNEAAAKPKQSSGDANQEESDMVRDSAPVRTMRDRRSRKNKTSGGAGALKTAAQNMLQFVRSGEALLEELKRSEDIGKMEQNTPEQAKSARGVIKRLKQEAEAAGDDTRQERSHKNYLRAVLQHLRRYTIIIYIPSKMFLF